MKKVHKLSIFIIFLSFFALGTVNSAKAFMPPEFAFNVGSQVIQFFALVVFTLSSIVGLFFKFLKIGLKKKKFIYTYILISLSSVLLISFVLASIYENYKQKEEYSKWVEESKFYSEQEEYAGEKEEEEGLYSPDKFKFEKKIEEEIKIIKESGDNFITAITEEGPGVIINNFYRNIINNEYEKAHLLTNEEISLNEFNNLYSGIDIVKINEITRITEELSSFELITRRKGEFYRHEVLIKISESKIRDVKRHLLEPLNDSQEIIRENDSGEKRFIEAETLKKKIEDKENDFIVLDIRRDFVYDFSHIPGSINIYYPDLVAGRWIELSEDKDIYVICFVGQGSKRVVDFLEKKNITVFYVVEGIKKYKEIGGALEGDTQIFSVGKYTENENLTNIFSTEDVKEKINEGAFLIDTRGDEKESLNFKPDFYITSKYMRSILDDMTTFDSKELVKSIAGEKEVIAICDTCKSCSVSVIFGILLDYYGGEFLGIYNKPWEY